MVIPGFTNTPKGYLVSLAKGDIKTINMFLNAFHILVFFPKPFIVECKPKKLLKKLKLFQIKAEI